MKSKTKKIILLLAAGCVGGVVLTLGGFTAVHSTSSDQFCAKCHSNHSLAAETNMSVHGNNRAGIVVKCADCHIAPGVGNVIGRKLAATKDVFVYMFTRNFNTQEWLEEHRQEEAASALNYIASVDSATCLSCHQKVASDVPDAMNPMAKRVHEYNNAKPEGMKKQCVYCHRGVAHKYEKEWFVSQSDTLRK